MNCPLCRSESQFVFEVKGFPVEDCTGCGHRFAAIPTDEQHVRTIYTDEYFNGGGAGYADYSVEKEMLYERGRMYARMIAPFVANGSLLDVGCAAGYILKGFADEGWRVSGVEPNATMAREGREQLSLDIHRGSFETLETADRFDLISMIQVAGHFYDPAAAFARAGELLKESGHLLIETWDRSSLMARILKTSWHEYSPPSVLQWYTKPELRTYLSGLGFEWVAGGRPSKKIHGSHVRSLLRYRIGESFLINLIPRNLDLPYPSEDLFWALYRKR